jgi:hypothetical protein
MKQAIEALGDRLAIFAGGKIATAVLVMGLPILTLSG